MNSYLEKIEFSWKMESVSDPFFTYDENGLKIYFMVSLGEECRRKDIDDYIGSSIESDIPDEIYNIAGLRTAYIEFLTFDSFLCIDRSSGVSNYSGDFGSGVYVEMSLENKVLGYVFIGHDLFLSVKAKEYSEYLKHL